MCAFTRCSFWWKIGRIANSLFNARKHLHYCQRTTASENWFLRPAGYDLETDRKRDKWLNGKALNRTAREADQNSLLPAWEAGISLNPVQMA